MPATRINLDTFATESDNRAVPQAIELFPGSQPILDQPRRMVFALLIAIAVHVFLLTLPTSLNRDPLPRRAPFHLTITHPLEPKTAPAPDVAQPTETKQKPESELSGARMDSTDIHQNRPSSPEPIQTQKKPDIPDEESPNSIDQPAPAHQPNTGAKPRSTVFDPRLAEKLADERNRVQKFESGDTEYMTTTGTFVQRGDRCWDVKQLIPDDTSSESSQWIRIKCTKTSRSKSDIDRLARKYGIP